MNFVKYNNNQNYLFKVDTIFGIQSNFQYGPRLEIGVTLINVWQLKQSRVLWTMFFGTIDGGMGGLGL